MEDYRDQLTGCHSKQQLELDLWNELGPVAFANRAQTVYTEQFLCCDINHFTEYLNQFGHHGGDEIIVKIARILESTEKTVYRFGGDEFVIPGVSAPIDDIDHYDLPVSIRQCIVDVELPIIEHRGLTATSWIIAHVQMALVQPSILNPNLVCRAPGEWAV